MKLHFGLWRKKFGILIALSIIILGLFLANSHQSVAIDRQPAFPSEQTVASNLWVMPDDELRIKSKNIVLLVTGANNTGYGVWSWGYGAQMPKQNILPASITLPNFNTADFNYSGKFVYDAVKQLKAKYPDKKITIVAHSAGNLATAWALHYRPTSMSRMVENYIAVGAPFKGIESSGYSALGFKEPTKEAEVPAMLQVAKGSNFIKEINSTPFPRGINYVSIISKTDEIATGQDPLYVASFPSGTIGETIIPQFIYDTPNAKISHVGELADNGIYELVRSFIYKEAPDLTARDRQYYPELQMPGFELTNEYGSTPSHQGDATKVTEEPVSYDKIEK